MSRKINMANPMSLRSNTITSPEQVSIDNPGDVMGEEVRGEKTDIKVIYPLHRPRWTRREIMDLDETQVFIVDDDLDNSMEVIPEHGTAKLDPKWQEQMVLQYAPLIKYIASHLALRLPSHISMEDLVSSGIIGLIDAVQKFDPSKNINFKTYSEFRIKGAMLDELRSLDWIPRSVRKKTHLIEAAYAKLQKSLGRPAEAEEVAEFMDLEIEEFYKLLDETKTVSVVPLEEGRKKSGGHAGYMEHEVQETIQDDSARDSLLAVHFSGLQEIMLEAIEALPDKEKLMISLYYYEELTMKEIGQIMGYTESRISQLHTQAIFRLKQNLRDYSQEV